MVPYLGSLPALLTFLIGKGCKMIPSNFLGRNKTIIVSNLVISSQAGTDFQRLIQGFNIWELKTLRDDEAFIDRVKKIAELDAEQLREHMVKKWSLTVESCQNDDWWVDVESIRDRCPVWTRAVIEGHYVDCNDFVQWARELLMEEVRVNINIKRIQELREKAKKRDSQQTEAASQFERAMQCGFYL